MQKIFKKITALFTTASYLACGVLAPCAQALATDQCSQESTQCVTVKVGNDEVTYPVLQLTAIGTATITGSGEFSFTLAKGDQRSVNLNTVATATGLSASEVASLVNTLPSNASIVYSRMSTLTGELDVNILKEVRHGKNVTLYSAKFTPQMGNRWAASRTFMTASEKAGSTGAGPNPFAAFEGGDQEFHNIPINNPYVAQTITGMAARFVNAPYAVLNMASFTEKTWVTTAHHFFTTTTTTHDAGYESPVWLVGLPPGMNDSGDISANYCLDALSGSSCPVSEHQVVSGMAWSNWSEGNLPVTTSTIHEFTSSHTGFNFLTFILVVASVLSISLTSVVAVFIHRSEQSADNIIKDMNLLVNSNLTTIGSVTDNQGSSISSSLGSNSFVTLSSTDSNAPFAASNLTTSTTATNPSGAFAPTSSNETYFQTIEGKAMTAPLGQSSTQSDSTGNNGYAAFSSFDQGYNNDIALSPNVNLNFNQLEYIQDTK